MGFQNRSALPGIKDVLTATRSFPNVEVNHIRKNHVNIISKRNTQLPCIHFVMDKHREVLHGCPLYSFVGVPKTFNSSSADNAHSFELECNDPFFSQQWERGALIRKCELQYNNRVQ